MIDIPGYRILRPLGHGGMASVHLAVQQSVEREVALKIMSPSLMGDPQFGERFLREARIAARLRHPHVVQVHDVGVAAGHHYMAMEYLPGGPAIVRDRPPRGLRFALKVTREIGSALGYAHGRGVIHRDIKPDNILLREDGAAVLTDFGIARANDNVRMTLTGSVMGTPSYMSPEQARGEELDGRSDLYSLGVVFFELLTGRVPYSAADQVSVGLMHLTAPLPALPPELGWLDPLLHRLLAKDRAERLGSGGELAEELAEIEQRFTPTPLRSGVALSTPPPSLTAPSAGAGPRSEREPILGAVEPERVGERSRRRHAPQHAGRRLPSWLIGVALAVCVGGAVAWQMQDRLRDLLPQSQTADALQRAELALEQGRLASDATGSGAHELFAAVLAIDPDNLRARDGLARVGDRWLRRAEQALAAGQHADAAAALEQARQLAVPAARIDALGEQLRQSTREEDALSAWLEQARAARDGGRLDEGENSALALYRRVLQQDPGNALARDGIGQVLAALAERARLHVDAGRHAEAEAQIARIAEAEPAFPELPALSARLAEARRQSGEALAARIQRAEGLLRQGRLTAPREDNALALFRAVLAEAPDEPRARRGVEEVARTLNTQFERAAADYQIERAETLLEALASNELLAGRPLALARERLDGARAREAALSAQRNREADPQRLRQLLDEAAQAVTAGNLWGPPGESAYDKYRQVQRVEPGNGEARQGLAQLPQRAAEHFEAALAEGRLGRARGYVEGLESSTSGSAGLASMKRRLSQAYAGFAVERLGAGELQRARDGFNQALELDPDNPDLVTLRARLEAAGG